MGLVWVDGRAVEIRDGERLNGIEAASRAGIEIPYYCWHPGLSVVGSCRMCLVEVGRRNPASGEIVMSPKLVPACNTPAADGTVFVTDSERVRNARAMVEEGLLLRHPIDCPICDKAGECLLQDYHFNFGQPERRAQERPFTSRRRDVGPTVTLFVDRCILCSRCVRFSREISGTGELMFMYRGAHEEIDVVAGFPLNNDLAGNVVDLCPVGALCDKDFLYRQRVWFMRRHAGVCPGCSSGCSIWIDENQDHIYRLRPRENPHVNRWWICDKGRYGFHHIHDPRRIRVPTRRNGNTTVPVDWQSLPFELGEQMNAVSGLAVVLSPFLTVEEAWLLVRLARRFDEKAIVAMGPTPIAGTERSFARGFTVRAEKCPNRRGVETIAARAMGRLVEFEAFLAELDRGSVRAAWVSGGYPEEWMDQAVAARFSRLDLLVVQDLFPSPLSDLATYVLPSAAFAERSGSYVNFADRLQGWDRAVRPPLGVRPEGALFWEMLGYPGLYNARAVLDELSRDILYFAPAVGPTPNVGVDLRVNLLADRPAGSDPTS